MEGERETHGERGRRGTQIGRVLERLATGAESGDSMNTSSLSGAGA